MRVLQLVDSLEIGGAETLAVNYANALAAQISFSGLAATRKEGLLKANIDGEVAYTFLQKRSAFDVKAIWKLRKFVKKNNIGIVHAHGTSYFMASLLKLITPQIKVVWHEHYGARANQTWKSNKILWVCAFFFDHIFVVNLQLKAWMLKNLHAKKVDYIPNFARFPKPVARETTLYGTSGKRIVCLANLKNPKNHLFLLKAFAKVVKEIPLTDWSLHLIGKDFNDSYSDMLKAYIQQNDLSGNVFIYGLKTDIENILDQTEIGVLASTNEGFPVSLLEFGLAGIPVLSTNAGFCGSIVEDGVTGLLFDPWDSGQLQVKMTEMLSGSALRKAFRGQISKAGTAFSEEKVIALLISKYASL